MKFQSALALALVSLTLAACDDKMDTPDGRIPSQYLSVAQKFVGEYKGQVNRVANAVNISLDGNKVVFNAANDFIAPVCESKVGDMLNFSYTEKDGVVRITGAQFAFNPNLCSINVLANRINVYFVNESTFEISYLEDYDRNYVCEVYPGNPPHSGPTQQCRWEQTPRYGSGKFVK